MRRFCILLAVAAIGAGTTYGFQATAAAPPPQLTVDVGDVIAVAGGSIGCKVVLRATVKTLDCRRAGSLPGTFGTMLNAKGLIVERFDTPRRATVILTATHGRRTVTRCS
jgi:hypothetical protein